MGKHGSLPRQIPVPWWSSYSTTSLCAPESRIVMVPNISSSYEKSRVCVLSVRRLDDWFSSEYVGAYCQSITPNGSFAYSKQILSNTIGRLSRTCSCRSLCVLDSLFCMDLVVLITLHIPHLAQKTARKQDLETRGTV